MADFPGSPVSSLSPADDDASIPEDATTTTAKYDESQPPATTTTPKTTTTNNTMPPSKRRRTNNNNNNQPPNTTGDQTPVSTHDDPLSLLPPLPPTSPTSTISSDTSGEVPNSPSTLALLGASQDDDYSGQGTDQVTVCRWEGCDAGDLGNMDGLVQHIRAEHVGGKHKKYLCEWADCSRKGQPHASGYALRAHMRSHTREKPFYCSIPECDRSFTRSDALTKHTRTVHENDSLRPAADQQQQQQQPPKPPTTGSGPGSASATTTATGPGPGAGTTGTTGTPNTKLQRIKLKLPNPPKDHPDSESQSQPDQQPQQPDQPPPTTTLTTTTTTSTQTQTPPQDPTPTPTPTTEDLNPPEYTPDSTLFDTRELSLPPVELFRLLRRQIHWAQVEQAQLCEEWERIRPLRLRAWREKEAVFDDVMDAQVRLFSELVGSVDAGVGGGVDAGGKEKEKEKDKENEAMDEDDDAPAPTRVKVEDPGYGPGGDVNGFALRQHVQHGEDEGKGKAVAVSAGDPTAEDLIS